jgi:hypothetical protein
MATKPPQLVTMQDFDDHTNIMIYSDSGVGKTVWCKDVDLIIAAEDGTVSAKRAGSTADVWRCTEWADIEAAYYYLEKEQPDYKVIALDSSTMVQRLAFKWYMEKTEKENPHRDQDLPGQQEHQKTQNIIKRFHELFCKLPYTTIFTAQTMVTENMQGDERIVPYVHGQKGDLSRYICGLMSAVGYMEIKELSKRDSDEKVEVRRIHWQPYMSGTYFGKDRYDALGKYTDNKTLPQILQMINASGAEGSRPRRTTRTAARPAARRTRKVG